MTLLQAAGVTVSTPPRQGGLVWLLFIKSPSLHASWKPLSTPRRLQINEAIILGLLLDLCGNQCFCLTRPRPAGMAGGSFVYHRSPTSRCYPIAFTMIWLKQHEIVVCNQKFESKLCFGSRLLYTLVGLTKCLEK